MDKLIFLLEDDDDIRQIITYILEDEGYFVNAFASVGEFRSGLYQTVPNLFLLDVMLPDGSGTEVCNQLKQSTGFEQTPVMLMSAGQVTNEQIQHADDFIRKPFDIDLFRNRINRLV